MKKAAFFFLILFTSFLCTPSLVSFMDDSVDISAAFTANEEETSSKTQVVFEYTLQDSNQEDLKSQFLQEQSALNFYYQESERRIFLKVLSPPPKQV